VIEFLARPENIKSASLVYQSFPKVMEGLRLQFWRNIDALVREELKSFPAWFCDFDDIRASTEADVVFIKPLCDKGSTLCCGISLGQGSTNPTEIVAAYPGVQWIGTGKSPWENPSTSKLESELDNAGLGRRERGSGWIRYKYLDVRLHDPDTLKKIAEKDQSTERVIVDQTIDLLCRVKEEILEASAAAAAQADVVT
jgi:hypothetical protein